MILEKKSGTDWVLPKIIGSGRVSGTRQALNIWEAHLGRDFLGEQEQQHQQMDEGSSKQGFVLQLQSDGSTSSQMKSSRVKSSI